MASSYFDNFVRNQEGFDETIQKTTNFNEANFGFDHEKTKLYSKQQFFENFKKSFDFHDLKERLKKVVQKVCNFNLKIKQTLLGVTHSEVDSIFSTLYSTLLDSMKEALKEQLQESTDEAFSNIISTKEFTTVHTYRIVQDTIGQNKQQRFCQLATEYDIFRKRNLALNRTKLLIDEGHLDVIPRYCSLLLKDGDLERAEEFVGKLLLKSENDVQSLIILLLIFLSQDRLDEGRVVLNRLTFLEPENQLVNALNYYLFTGLNMDEIASRFMAISIRSRQRKLKKITASKDEMPQDLGLGQEAEPLTDEETDDIWREVAHEVNTLNFPKISDFFYQLLSDKECTKSKLLAIGLMLQQGEDIKAYKLLKEMSALQPRDTSLLELFMELCLKMKKFKRAETLLLNLIGQRYKKVEMLINLGLLKLKLRRYEEARIIFFKTVEISKHSVVAWIGLGKSCSALSQFKDACEAFKFANILDPLNSEIWLDLINISLRDTTRSNETFFCIRELLKLNLQEIEQALLLESTISLLNEQGKSSYSMLILKQLSQQRLDLTERTQTSQIALLNLQIAKKFFQLNNYDSARTHIDLLDRTMVKEGELKEVERMEAAIGEIQEVAGEI